jgi:hypothetical protein
MTNLRFSAALCLLPIFGVPILAATSSAQQRPSIIENLAKTYGLDSFGQIEAIRYTFNAEAPGLNLSRSWTWAPKTDQVTYEGKDKSGKGYVPAFATRQPIGRGEGGHRSGLCKR